MGKRNYEWPAAEEWDPAGFSTQDKEGGVTERVSPSQVIEKLAEVFPTREDLADQSNPAKGAGLLGWAGQTVGAWITSLSNGLTAAAAWITNAADQVDPLKGAGLIGWASRTVGGWLDWLRWVAGGRVSLLHYIPAAEHSKVFATTGPMYDASVAFQAMHDQNLPGTVCRIPGRVKLGQTVHLTKPMKFIGGGNTITGEGPEIWRANALDAPAFILGGGEDDADAFAAGIFFDGITFRDERQYVIGGTMRSAHFMHINAWIKGGFSNCYFNSDMLGAWIYIRRAQDFPFYNCFFRGGGSDLGDYAQILFGTPQGSEETATHPVNEIVFTYCTFEWGPNTGNAYTDPVTGAPAVADGGGLRPSRGSVAVKAIGTGVDAKHNSCRWIGCKFEMTTSRGWDGEGLRKAAIRLHDVAMFQFVGCEWNQTSRIFEATSCPSLRIDGTSFYGGGQGAADNRRRFGKFVDCDQLRIDVRGYNQSSAEVIRCPGAIVNVDAPLGTTGAPRFTMDQRNQFGARYLQTFFKTLSGATLIEDKRGSTGHAIQSRLIEAEADYGSGLLELFPTSRKERPHGMTIKVRACLKNAPTGNHVLQFGWYWFPRDTVYFSEPDGVRTEWDVPMYFAPDDDFPGSTTIANPILAYKRHKITGVETPVTIVTKNGEGSFDGGSVVLAEAVPATHEVIIRRTAYGKGIIVLPSSGTLDQTPRWYSAFIPPNVLRLEGVVIQVRHGGDWGAGLQYQVLDWDYAEEAESPTIPYYPSKADEPYNGAGLPPGGNGWSTKSMVKCQGGDQGGVYYRWIAGTDSGAGSWALVTPSFQSYVHTGGADALELPSAESVGNIPGLRYTVHNAGTGNLTVSPAAGDPILSVTWDPLSFILAPGESCALEMVASGGDIAWSIMFGISSIATLAGTSNPTQVVASGSAVKITSLFNTAVLSHNCTADATNKKIRTERSGMYRAELSFSGPLSAALVLPTWSIRVDGVTVGTLKGLEYFGAASQEEMVALVGSLGYIPAGKDVELYVQQSSGSSVTFTAWNIALSVYRV